MSRAERERREEEAAKIFGPSPLAALAFGVLALLAALWMLSAWTVVDLDGGRVRVERRTWWGLCVQETEFPQSVVAKVEVSDRGGVRRLHARNLPGAASRSRAY